MIGKYHGFGKNVLDNIKTESKEKVYVVTSFVDEDKAGTLRYGINRVNSNSYTKILFGADGDIILKSPLTIKCRNLIIDGGGHDVVISDYPLNISASQNILVQNISVRGSDLRVLEENRKNRVRRPKTSANLDVINIDGSHTVAIYHCSLYWSADEIVSVTRSQNVTIGYCILAYPLSNPKIHPYGDNHAYCSNNSASTVTYHHNIFAHFVMRGPQFEANDNNDKQSYNAQFEAINNLIYGYTQSGSRYSIGFEERDDYVQKIRIDYQFISNIYVNTGDGVDIEVIDRYGSHVNYPNKKPSGPTRNDRINVVIEGNQSEEMEADVGADDRAGRRLFNTGIPIQKTKRAYDLIMAYAGNYNSRSNLDHSVISDIATRARPKIAHSIKEFYGM